jgi:hypothetical protein
MPLRASRGFVNEQLAEGGVGTMSGARELMKIACRSTFSGRRGLFRVSLMQVRCYLFVIGVHCNFHGCEYEQEFFPFQSA